VVDHPLETRPVEQVEERGVRLLAGVVERVFVGGRTAVSTDAEK